MCAQGLSAVTSASAPDPFRMTHSDTEEELAGFLCRGMRFREICNLLLLSLREIFDDKQLPMPLVNADAHGVDLGVQKVRFVRR